VAALWTCVDTGRNRSGAEFFSSEGTATLNAYMKMLKSGLWYVGIICHGVGPFLVRSWLEKIYVLGKEDHWKR
jgi:hypothetical protein